MEQHLMGNWFFHLALTGLLQTVSANIISLGTKDNTGITITKKGWKVYWSLFRTENLKNQNW